MISKTRAAAGLDAPPLVALDAVDRRDRPHNDGCQCRPCLAERRGAPLERPPYTGDPFELASELDPYDPRSSDTNPPETTGPEPDPQADRSDQ